MNDEVESILASVKSAFGIKDPEMTAFDTDLVIFINSAIATLTQLGVGPEKGFSITGPDETYTDFLGDQSSWGMVKAYIIQKVRLLWDPPQTSAHTQVLKESIQELEWRLNTLADLSESDVQEVEAQIIAYRRGATRCIK